MVRTVENTPVTTWTVTGHAACRAALRDDERFPAGAETDTAAARQRRHSAYQALAPKRRCVALAPEMDRIAAQLVGALPPGRIDLVDQLAAPFAEAVLDLYFGLPQPAWRDYYQRWRETLRPSGGQRGDPLTEMVRATRFRLARGAFLAALRLALQDRRREPRDDVLTGMALAADAHAGYTDADTLRIVPTLANNALLGLTDLAGTVLWHLLAHPSVVAEIGGDERALVGAIEEILRLEPPVQAVQRQTAISVELDGEAIPAGVPVLVRLADANRDETVFPDPHRLDVRRLNSADHLSFGYGTDYCIGAPLVRRATLSLASSFLTRVGAIRLADDASIEHWTNPFNRGLQRLDVLVEG